MTTFRNKALAELVAAQQRLPRLLLAQERDPQQIIEAADAVRRLELQATAAERGGE